MRRHLVLIALLAASIPMAGCGDDGDQTPGGPDPGAFSSTFSKLTGVELDSRELSSWTQLRSVPAESSTGLGFFTIYVLKEERAREVLLTGSDEEKLEKGEGGAYYESNRSGYTAKKEYGENILVSTQLDQRRPDDEFERLDRAIRASIAGDPSLIAPADRDCEGAGIDAAEGEEGQCRLDGRALTVVNSGSELKVPVLGAKLVGVTRIGEIPARRSYAEPEPARGEFVVVRYALENTGDEPITSVRPSLIVDGRTYTESDLAYKLTDYSDSPFPLQPGETQEVTTAFDIPEEAASAAVERGLLELPAARYDGSGGLNDREAVGRIRLAGAPSYSLKGASGDPGSGGESSAPEPPAKSVRTRGRERAAQQALKKFYTALRTGNIKTVCARLTEAAQQQFGGEAACSSGKRIKPEAQAKAPKSNENLMFTTILTRQESRATILVRREGGGFTDAARLARQGDLWRIQGTRRLSGK